MPKVLAGGLTAAVGLGAEPLEVVQHLDGDEGMLVHRVTMVEVTRDQRVDSSKLRDQQG